MMDGALRHRVRPEKAKKKSEKLIRKTLKGQNYSIEICSG